MNKALNISKIPLILAILLALLISTKYSLAVSSDWVVNDKSKVRLISAKTSIDNSNNILVALEYQLEKDWKTYWKSPGGGGFPQKIIWNNSQNIENIEIDWPTPKEFEILGLTSLGYEEKVIFPLEIKLKDKNQIADININVNYLVCKNICIPGNANLFLELQPGKGNYTEFFHEIEKVRSSLPVQNINLTPIYDFDTKVTKYLDQIEIEIVAKSDKEFFNSNVFLHTPFGLPVEKSTDSISFNLKKLNSKFKFKSDQFSVNEFPLEVIINDQNHNFHFIKTVTINDGSLQITNSIYYFIFISIVGGLILNLMPCVFPVLSIKFMSFLNNPLENIRLSFLYTAIGIISSFVILALFFLSLQQFGISISWGMQFQEPYFLFIILFVLTIFSLNTLGLFEIRLPTFLNNSKIFNLGEGFFSKNFFNGFFATLLATPCTAPFVGSAITIAFTQSSFILIAIFVSMGFGMSLPYIFVSIFPNSINFFPKSAKWTMYVKYFLSALLIATIVWVLNILSNFYNEYFIIFFLIIVLVLISSFRFNFFKFSVLCFSIVFLFTVPLFELFEQDKDKQLYDNWLNFKEVNISTMIDQNEVIFIDITAEWCATCQFNKINILDDEKIKKIFKENNIKLIRADWTKPDRNIDAFLKQFNKFGIPFNAFFSQKYPDGIIMSEILTEKEIRLSIEKLI